MSVPSLHACGAVPAVALPSHWRSAASPRVQDVVSQQLGHEWPEAQSLWTSKTNTFRERDQHLTNWGAP